MNSNDDPTDYGKVGYKRPPVATRFKKGQSGNPGGRPRKAISRRHIAEKVLSEKQRLGGQPQGTRVWFPNLELVVMTLKQLAASGHHQGTKLFDALLTRHGTQEPPTRKLGYLIVPEVLSEEEWEARYSPKDDPPDEPGAVE